MSMSQPRLLAAMAAHIPRLPVLLFVFLALHVPASHGDPLPTTYDSSMCLESSFWCGSVEIRYPFYLANSTKATDDYNGNYSCGYTDLEISCQGEEPSASPVIRLGNDTYTVQDISYDSDNYTVTLTDSDVLVGGSCPAVRHGVTFDRMWLHSTSSNDDLTFYFGCYSRGPPMPAGLHKYQIDCNGFESPVGGGGVAFVLTPDDHDKAQEHDLAADCNKVVSVLVKTEVLEVARTWTNFTSGAYGYVLKQGFELGWSPTKKDECPQCEESGGKCAYRQNKTFLGCLCSDRKVVYPHCNSTAPAPAPARAPSSSLERQHTGHGSRDRHASTPNAIFGPNSRRVAEVGEKPSFVFTGPTSQVADTGTC